MNTLAFREKLFEMLAVANQPFSPGYNIAMATIINETQLHPLACFTTFLVGITHPNTTVRSLSSILARRLMLDQGVLNLMGEIARLKVYEDLFQAVQEPAIQRIVVENLLIPFANIAIPKDFISKILKIAGKGVVDKGLCLLMIRKTARNHFYSIITNSAEIYKFISESFFNSKNDLQIRLEAFSTLAFTFIAVQNDPEEKKLFSQLLEAVFEELVSQASQLSSTESSSLLTVLAEACELLELEESHGWVFSETVISNVVNAFPRLPHDSRIVALDFLHKVSEISVISQNQKLQITRLALDSIRSILESSQDTYEIILLSIYHMNGMMTPDNLPQFEAYRSALASFLSSWEDPEEILEDIINQNSAQESIVDLHLAQTAVRCTLEGGGVVEGWIIQSLAFDLLQNISPSGIALINAADIMRLYIETSPGADDIISELNAELFLGEPWRNASTWWERAVLLRSLRAYLESGFCSIEEAVQIIQVLAAEIFSSDEVPLDGEILSEGIAAVSSLCLGVEEAVSPLKELFDWKLSLILNAALLEPKLLPRAIECISILFEAGVIVNEELVKGVLLAFVEEIDPNFSTSTEALYFTLACLPRLFAGGLSEELSGLFVTQILRLVGQEIETKVVPDFSDSLDLGFEITEVSLVSYGNMILIRPWRMVENTRRALDALFDIAGYVTDASAERAISLAAQLIRSNHTDEVLQSAVLTGFKLFSVLSEMGEIQSSGRILIQAISETEGGALEPLLTDTVAMIIGNTGKLLDQETVNLAVRYLEKEHLRATKLSGRKWRGVEKRVIRGIESLLTYHSDNETVIGFFDQVFGELTSLALQKQSQGDLNPPFSSEMVVRLYLAVRKAAQKSKETGLEDFERRFFESEIESRLSLDWVSSMIEKSEQESDSPS